MTAKQTRTRDSGSGTPTGSATLAGETPVTDTESSRAAQADASVVTLEARLGIADVAALHQRMIAATEDVGEVVIDAGQVRVLDTAVLQLLLVHVQAWRLRGVEVEWSGLSEAFADAARLLGVAAGIGLPARP